MAATDGAKLSVSGQAFVALLDCCGTALGDCDGLLFGRAARPPAPPPSFSDDDDTPTSSAPTLSISITGHASLAQPSSLSDALGRFQPYTPASPGPATVGFFSCRRSATLRPSMREAAVARSLAKSLALTHPIVFLILAPSASSNLSVHTFDYRAFLLVEPRLVPASLQVVNVGPGFWGHYHTFAAESPMPWMPRPPASRYGLGEEKAMDGMTVGFGPERLQTMLTSATGHATEVDVLYTGMIRKLQGLAREVEDTSRRARHQEVKNLVLRKKIAGLK